VRSKAAREVAALLTVDRVPMRFAVRAYARIYPELLRQALTEPSDLYYGFARTLAEPAAAARRLGVPYALDLEDFHSAEQEENSANELTHRLAAKIERNVLPGAAFLTAGSDAIGEEYTTMYGVHPLTINNTFALPEKAPRLEPSSGDRLRLYWFSQTIGPNRGLEDAVLAAGLSGAPMTLSLRGRPLTSYVEGLRQVAATHAPNLELEVLNPGPPDSMVELAAGFDIGLALEQPHVLNRELCLTNKAFTYVLAGLAVVFTDTRGQRRLAEDLGEGAVLYRAGDVAGLAGLLSRFAANKQVVARAKTAAWAAALRRWHWEHEEERGALLNAVASALDSPNQLRARR
jgi:hypothetical protein